VVKSDLSGRILIRPKKSKRGIKPSQDEWQIDHIIPKSKGGGDLIVIKMHKYYQEKKIEQSRIN